METTIEGFGACVCCLMLANVAQRCLNKYTSGKSNGKIRNEKESGRVCIYRGSGPAWLRTPLEASRSKDLGLTSGCRQTCYWNGSSH